MLNFSQFRNLVHLHQQLIFNMFIVIQLLFNTNLNLIEFMQMVMLLLGMALGL
jgi:hypothetical protein